MLPPIGPEAFELSVEQQLIVEKVRREVPHLPRHELEQLTCRLAELAEKRQATVRFLINEWVKNHDT